MNHLPVELIREIFTFIIYQESSCWQLDMLNVSMVSKSWYRISMELMQPRHRAAPWLALMNHAGFQRNFPFRTKVVKVLKEAPKCFHKQVDHLVIDFASFDTIRREKINNNLVIKKKVHHSEALKNTVDIIKLCGDSIKRLDIVFDAGFTSLVSSHDNRILYASQILGQALLGTNKIKQLVLVGYNPIQRCPCCAGKEWDHYLYPILKNLLCLDTLVLQNVLPSPRVFEHLASLKKIVFYKSMVTIPTRGDTTVNCIPTRLWRQIKSIQIFEDIEDATTWKCKRYLNELVDHVGPQLENFVLQFGTKEENEQCVVDGVCIDSRKDKLYIQDTKSPLNQLKYKCKDSLKQVLLINVPPTI